MRIAIRNYVFIIIMLVAYSHCSVYLILIHLFTIKCTGMTVFFSTVYRGALVT